MIEEAYVSFETAKLLKEKGFADYRGHLWYDECGVETFVHYVIKEPAYPECTQQMACRWLREDHKIHIQTMPYSTSDGFRWAYKISSFNAEDCSLSIINCVVRTLKEKAAFKNSEDATESAIKYCLENLI